MRFHKKLDEVILRVLGEGVRYDISIIPEDNSVESLVNYGGFSNSFKSDFDKCLAILVRYHKETLLEPKKLSLCIKTTSGKLKPEKRKLLEGIVDMHNDYVLQASSPSFPLQ